MPYRGFQPTLDALKTWMVPVAAVSGDRFCGNTDCMSPISFLTSSLRSITLTGFAFLSQISLFPLCVRHRL